MNFQLKFQQKNEFCPFKDYLFLESAYDTSTSSWNKLKLFCSYMVMSRLAGLGMNSDFFSVKFVIPPTFFLLKIENIF
jgi:hypothetical protein